MIPASDPSALGLRTRAATGLPRAKELARTLLYEGYLLYPYRPSALKNRKRWAMGTLYPPAFAREASDRCRARLECLVQGGAPEVRAYVCFLHGVERHDAGGTWHEASDCTIEAVIGAGEMDGDARVTPFELEGASWRKDGAEYVRHALRGKITASAARLGADLHRLSVEVANETPFVPGDRDAAHVRGLIAAHLLLHSSSSRFISATDPPEGLAALVDSCHSSGLYPALIGPAGDVLLASPIIVPDQAVVAPESAGDLFDATEIDEILTLRILTMTPEEIDEAQRADPRARALIERTQALGDEQRLALHGARRSGAGASCRHAPGDPVRIHPKPGGDSLDVVLKGERATVQAVEVDLEGRVHVAVVLDRDPGKDLGIDGQPGHRFFFSPDELEGL